MKRLAMIVVLAVMLVSMAAGVISFMPHASNSCAGDSIVVVFPNTYSEEQKRMFMDALRNALTRYGVLEYNYCSKTESDIPGLRMYPAILVQGKVSGRIVDLVSGSFSDYALIDYAVPAVIALQLNLPVEYRAEATLVIVNGSTPWGRPAPNLNMTRFIELVEAMAAVKVTRVEYSTSSRYMLPYYPGIVLLSSTDLTHGNRYVVRIGENTYTFKNDTLAQISSIAGNGVTEIPARISPPAGSPSLGPENATAALLVFEDFACPYCARFYQTMYESTVRPLVDEGKLRMVFIDFIVHSQVENLHRLMWCVYRVTGDAEAYEDLVKTIYSVLLGEGSPPTLSELLSMVEEKLGKSVAEEASKCAGTVEATKHLEESRSLAAMVGAHGTPTLAIVAGNVTLVIHGLPDPTVLAEILNYAIGQGRG